MNQYTHLTPDQLNAAIAERKGSQIQNWVEDTKQALELLQEVCSPPEGSRLARTIDIMAETRNGSPWFELSNIFIQEDNGEYTLLGGWNERTDPPIWFEGPDLSPLCCLAWLTITDPENKLKRKINAKIPPAYEGLFKVTYQKRVETVINRLQKGLEDLGHKVDREALETIVGDAIQGALSPDTKP